MLHWGCLRDNQERIKSFSHTPHGQVFLRYVLGSLAVEGDAAHDASFDWIYLIIQELIRAGDMSQIYQNCLEKRHERRNLLNLVDVLVSKAEEAGMLKPAGAFEEDKSEKEEVAGGDVEETAAPEACEMKEGVNKRASGNKALSGGSDAVVRGLTTCESLILFLDLIKYASWPLPVG